MPTAYTSLLGLALPVTGELSGTWGDLVNTQLTALLETAIAGTTTLSTDADVTLTTTTGAANQARAAVLLWTASNTVTRNVTAPAQSKLYAVVHAGGSGSVVLRGVGPTTGVTIVTGEKCLAAWNGSDFVKIASTIASGFTGQLPIANGGTASATAQTAINTLAGGVTDARVLRGNGTNIVLAQVAAATDISGQLPVANGGSGAATLTGILKGNGTSAFTAVTAPSGAIVGDTDTQTLSAKTLTNPTVTNYVETLYAPSAGSAFTVDLTNGTVQKLTTNNNVTITLPSSVSGKSYVIIVAYGGTHTVTWAGGSTIKWAGGSAPTATSTNGKFDFYVFTCDGTNTYGRSGGSNF